MTSHAVAMVVTGHDMTDERAMRQQVQQQERLAAVGTLAAGLAHEIRNPLNGAQLHIAFLERALNKRSRPNLDAETRDALEAVGVVRDELGRLARLVTDFLDFARPRPLTLEPTKLRDLCARAIEMVTPQVNASTAPIAMRVDLPTTDLVLAVDRDKLEQVLLNLLLNSIEAVSSDARPAPGGTIVLRARREPRHVWIEVEDDGPGLAKSDAPIFDAFFSTKPHGTGLGLSIAHRVVTDHGGTIDVESSPGRTRFRVTLPLSDQGVR